MTTELQVPGVEGFVAIARWEQELRPPRCDCRLPVTLAPCEHDATWSFVNHCGAARFSCDECRGLVFRAGVYVCGGCMNRIPAADVDWRPLR